MNYLNPTTEANAVTTAFVTRLAAASELAHQHCPRCGTGILTLVAYDPTSDYANGQGEALGDRVAVASYQVRCGQCDYQESRVIPTITA